MILATLAILEASRQCLVKLCKMDLCNLQVCKIVSEQPQSRRSIAYIRTQSLSPVAVLSSAEEYVAGILGCG